MFTSTSRPREGDQYDYYRCFSYDGCKPLRKAQIEQLIIDTVTERILQPDILNDIYTRYKNTRSSLSLEVEQSQNRIKLELRSTTTAIDNILSAIKDMGHSTAMLQELDKLENKKAELEQEALI